MGYNDKESKVGRHTKLQLDQERTLFILDDWMQVESYDTSIQH